MPFNKSVSESRLNEQTFALFRYRILGDETAKEYYI